MAGHVGGGPLSLVVMGASGAGKTTLGAALAARVGARFIDADDHHPAANVAKMRSGQALSEGDRTPWLAALRALLDEARTRHEPVVLACSALRKEHRARLGIDGRARKLVFLQVPRLQLAQRLQERRGHFAGPALLEDQWARLEPPASDEGALWLDGTKALAELEDRVAGWLAAHP